MINGTSFLDWFNDLMGHLFDWFDDEWKFSYWWESVEESITPRFDDGSVHVPEMSAEALKIVTAP